MSLPKRTPDTMSDAIALSSPSGRMSKRARKDAEKRLAVALFGDSTAGLKGERPKASSAESKLRAAKTLRELAERGMSRRKFTRGAERLEAEARAMMD